MKLTRRMMALLIMAGMAFMMFALPSFAESVNILKNGGFEEVTEGKPNGWGLSGATVGNGFEIAAEGAKEGKNAVHFTHTGTNMYVSNVGNVVGGTEYEFTASLKGKGSFQSGPSIKLTWQKPDGKGSFETLDNHSAAFKPSRSGIWETVSYKATAPAAATRVILLVRLNESGECWWDDVKILGQAGTGTVSSATKVEEKLTAPADDAYPQAPVSATQDIQITSLGNGTFNLLKNGSFETVASTGLPTGWNLFGGNVYSEAMTAASDAAEGNNFLRFFGETSSVYVAQTVTGAIAGETYTFSADVRKMPETAGYASLNIQCQKPSGSSHETIETVKVQLETEEGKWKHVTHAFTVPAETTRLIFMLRLIGGGEMHWDNVQCIGSVDADMAFGIEFRAKLAAEKSASRRVEKTFGEKYVKDAPASGQPENILTNGGFEANDGTVPENWTLLDKFSSFGSLAKGEGYNGSDALRFSIGKEDGLKNPYYSQDVKITGGAEYQVSYRYKITAGSSAVPVVKLEYWSDRSLPGAGSTGSLHARAENYIYDGQWHEASIKFYPAENAAEMTVLARLLQSGEEDAEVYLDDIAVCMTMPPSAMKLDTNQIFYYEDMQSGTFTANLNLPFFPELSEAGVDFRLYDMDTKIWESGTVQAVEGKASVSFTLSTLTKTEHPYCLEATVYYPDGRVADVQTQNIFRYPRPAYLGKDGVYMKNGTEPFYPVYAYHVRPEHFKKAATAGINLVQMGSFSNADQAVERLDAAQEAGIMGFIALYYGMKPAGDETNIDRTIDILRDPRVQNHPALFGYGVMDEVFLQLSNPYEVMENSYRLIRSLDKNRPIMTMEAMENYYSWAAKYVDILCIDPYSSAEVGSASVRSDAARAAVSYEKPVYALLEAYYTTHGRWPLPDDGRNNNYQALISGATAVGYYSISDSDVGANGEDVAIWDARDGGALWNELHTFGTVEKDLVYGHFVQNLTPDFSEYRGESYWYSAWVQDGCVYMVVLGRKEGQSLPVSIPLQSFAGDIKIGAYTAEVVAGRADKTPIVGNGTLDMTISGVEAVLYKITPSEPVDFSKLGATAFEDLENHAWARQQIARLDSLGIVDGRSDWEYAPAENITRAELAAFLVRTLGITGDGADNFADVPANHAYAKELAQGKAAGIINGIGDNMYNPDANITRQELMTMISRGMKLSGEADISGFLDASAVADWAIGHVRAMIASGLIQGNADGTLNPLGNTTRAEAAVIMNRILG